MQHLSPRQLADWLNDTSRPRPVLLDVREPAEFEICHIEGAKLVPMRTIPAHMIELDREAATVVICHHGARSFQVGAFLENQGFTGIHNLTGGVDAWRQEVDPAMRAY